MATHSASPSAERANLDRARDYANRIVAEAVSQHGLLEVLAPMKRHYSAITGREFASGNQVVVQAKALKHGFESRQWVTQAAVARQAGNIKKGEVGARLISVQQRFTDSDKLDADGRPVINPETGVPDRVRVYDGPKRFFPLTVYNLEQTTGYQPDQLPMRQEPGRRLPTAIASVWEMVQMPLPQVKASEDLAYDITKDELFLPSRRAFVEHRQATNAAYALTTHLAMAAGHASRLNIPHFNDPDLYRHRESSVAVATYAAAGMFMNNHCDRFDPAIIEQTGISASKNLATKLRDEDANMHMVMAQAHSLYQYMATGTVKVHSAPATPV